jgi:2-dehydropantoate 2-reductase
VTLVGTWPEGLAALIERGITLDDGARTQTQRVGARRLGAKAPPADFALVLVKAWQTAAVAPFLPSLLKPQGIAITLQNGLGNVEALAQHVGVDRALAGITTQGATLLGPAQVREGGPGLTTLPDAPALAPFVDLLRVAGFSLAQSPIANLQSLLWGKLVVNCGINALTALLRVPNGELLNRPTALALMDRAALECATVAQRLTYPLPFSDPVARVREVAQKTAQNRSSMFQDILRGAPTEIDAINGAVTQHGARRGVPTPVNEMLWQLVKALTHPPR